MAYPTASNIAGRDHPRGPDNMALQRSPVAAKPLDCAIMTARWTIVPDRLYRTLTGHYYHAQTPVFPNGRKPLFCYAADRAAA